MTDANDDVEGRVLKALADLSVEHLAVRIDPEHAGTAVFCERYGYSMEASANCIVVASKTGEPRYAACLVQATERLDVNGTVRRLLGARKVSFAPADRTVELTGMLPDGVTPFGLPADLPLYIDAPIVQLDRVIVGGGSRSLKLQVPGSALAALPAASVIEGLSKAPG